MHPSSMSTNVFLGLHAEVLGHVIYFGGPGKALMSECGMSFSVSIRFCGDRRNSEQGLKSET